MIPIWLRQECAGLLQLLGVDRLFAGSGSAMKSAYKVSRKLLHLVGTLATAKPSKSYPPSPTAALEKPSADA